MNLASREMVWGHGSWYGHTISTPGFIHALDKSLTPWVLSMYLTLYRWGEMPIWPVLDLLKSGDRAGLGRPWRLELLWSTCPSHSHCSLILTWTCSVSCSPIPPVQLEPYRTRNMHDSNSFRVYISLHESCSIETCCTYDFLIVSWVPYVHSEGSLIQVPMSEQPHSEKTFSKSWALLKYFSDSLLNLILFAAANGGPGAKERCLKKTLSSDRITTLHSKQKLPYAWRNYCELCF